MHLVLQENHKEPAMMKNSSSFTLLPLGRAVSALFCLLVSVTGLSVSGKLGGSLHPWGHKHKDFWTLNVRLYIQGHETAFESRIKAVAHLLLVVLQMMCAFLVVAQIRLRGHRCWKSRVVSSYPVIIKALSSVLPWLLLENSNSKKKHFVLMMTDRDIYGKINIILNISMLQSVHYRRRCLLKAMRNQYLCFVESTEWFKNGKSAIKGTFFWSFSHFNSINILTLEDQHFQTDQDYKRRVTNSEGVKSFNNCSEHLSLISSSFDPMYVSKSAVWGV